MRHKISNKKFKWMLLLAIFVFFGLYSTPEAFSQEEKYFPPSIGPTMAYCASVNGFTNPQGRKNGFALNNIPDAGITLYLPLDYIYNLGLYFDFQYTTSTYLMKYGYDGAKEEYSIKDRMRFSYFSISPSFSHAGFMLGFSYKIPVSADWEGVTIGKGKLENIFEIKAGYTYPLYNDEVGRLNVFLNASYALSGIYKDFKNDDPLRTIVPSTDANQIITNYYNPRPATIQLGFSFLFNLINLPEDYYDEY
jgi:hypothetical protein